MIRGFQFDLVILHTGQSGYERPLRERILSVLRDTDSESFPGRNGGLRLLSADQMDAETKAGLQAAAHVVLGQDAADLSELLDRMLEGRFPAPPFTPTGGVGFDIRQPLPRPSSLEFDNGLGGFDPDTGDYVIHRAPGANTPAPWCNVLSNEHFGTIVSESGLGFTWAVNSGENRLTPWSNDPVAAEPGEVLYGIQRQLAAAGHDCVVVAPSPIPRKPGDRIKTDRRDAINLAKSHRADALTTVWIPDPAHEAMRDLVRARLAAVRSLRHARK